MVRMEIVGVRVEVPANTPVVILRDTELGNRLLPIMIGSAEASAIHAALEGIEAPRPMTHDLLVATIDALDADVCGVAITEIREHTFYAELQLRRRKGAPTDGPELTVSCRPSDALAIALRASAPIEVASAVLDEAAIDTPTEGEADVNEDELVGEFREFLDEINPEDFSD